MNILAVVIVVIYVIALMLRWYQNFWMVLESFNLPLILHRMTNRTIYMVVTFILTYGSIIGIGYFYGLWAGLVALIIRMIVGRVSFSHYFNREVREYAEWEYQQMFKDQANANVPLERLSSVDRLRMSLERVEKVTASDEPSMRQEAYRRAREALHHRMMRGGD